METRSIWAALLLSTAALAADKPVFTAPGSSTPTWTSTAPTTILWANPCEATKAGCYITIYGEDGKELVHISQRTGKVTLAHPERTDEAGRQFWHAIETAFATSVCPKTH